MKTEETQYPVKNWLLKNGNAPGNPQSSPRCGARAKTGACQQPGRRLPDGTYTRCRLHGGNGAVRNWKHGLYSEQSRRQVQVIRWLVAHSRALIAQLE